MNDENTASVPSAASRPATAGGLLRQARQAQGLHIAALAAAIKVVPRKLELLESDQFDQLPDATFARALAQAVCRFLKIDPAPVLALLPPLNGHRLEQVASGLNTPFRERPGRLVPSDLASAATPVLWLAALIVALTVAVYAIPANWLSSLSLGGMARLRGAGASTPTTVVSSVALPGASSEAASGASSEASPAASGESPAEGPSTATTSTAGSVSTLGLPGNPGAASAGATGVAPGDGAVKGAAANAEAAASDVAGPGAAGAPVSGILQIHATAQTWVGVTDARGASLIGRLLQPGESVGIDGAMPMKVRVGNAGGTQMVFKGRPLDLRTYARDNVARFDLK